MKTKVIINLLSKQKSSISSNLRQYLRNRSTNKTFWYFHDSDHFKDTTFRNERYLQNSCNEIQIRKQLTDSVIKNSNNFLSDSVLHTFPLKTKLYVLDTLCVIRGNDHKNTIHFFDTLRPEITFELQKQNIYVLIQILYLSSIVKTDNKNDFSFLIAKIVQRIEDFFLNESPNEEQLTSTDVSVLCHSLFRLKTKFKTNSILKTISNIVCEDIKTGCLDKSHVISIVKYFRYNEFNDQKLIESLKTFIELNSNTLSFTECVHYLAFFANLSLYDRNIYDKLCDQRVNHLFKTYSSESNEQSIRVKDLARFLWSVSTVNHKLNQNITDFVIKQIETLFSSDFTLYPHFLIDCFKSLIILGVFPEKLLIQSLDSKQWSKHIQNSDRNKVSKDLYFILESIAIERPDIRFERRSLLYSMAKELKHNITQECKQRPELLKYFNELKGLETGVQLSYCLQHIGIASIVCKDNSLEVLDKTTTVANDCHQLNGLMATKIRQMKVKNINHFFISNNTCNHLKHFLTQIH